MDLMRQHLVSSGGQGWWGEGTWEGLWASQAMVLHRKSWEREKMMTVKEMKEIQDCWSLELRAQTVGGTPGLGRTQKPHTPKINGHNGAMGRGRFASKRLM